MAGKGKTQLTSTAIRGAAWVLTATIGQNLFRVAAVVVLARILTPEDFGVVAAALVVVGLAQLLVEMGFSTAVVQRAELTRAHIRTCCGIAWLIGMTLFATTVTAADFVATVFGMDALTGVMSVMALVFLFNAAGTTSKALMQRELQVRNLSLISLVAFLLGRMGLSIVLALLGFGVWALVLGHVTTSLVESLLCLRARPEGLRPGFDGVAFRDLLGYGLGTTWSKFVSYVALKGDYFVVGRWLGADALGVYSRAYQFITIPANLITAVLGRVAFPAFSRVQNEPDRVVRGYRRAVALAALGGIPTGVVLYVLGPEIVLVLLGPRWTGVIEPFQVLGAATYLRSGYKLSATVVRASGRIAPVAMMHTAFAVVVVGGSIVGQAYGTVGVAIAAVIALATNFIGMSVLGCRSSGLSGWVFASLHAPAVFLTAIVGGTAWLAVSGGRAADWSPFWTLLLGLAACVIAAFAAVRGAPRLALGEEGAWWFETLRSRHVQDR